jgi:hypothetical protein
MAQAIQQSQKSLWESFQKLLGHSNPPAQDVGVTNGVMQPNDTNPFAPKFLAGLEKFGSNVNRVKPTPYQTPAPNAYGQGFQGGQGQLPADSYAAAIQSMVQRYQQ